MGEIFWLFTIIYGVTSATGPTLYGQKKVSGPISMDNKSMV